MKNVVFTCIAALMLLCFSKPLTSNAHIAEQSLMADEVTWYHFVIYDPDCGTMVYDGWVNWTGPGTYDGYCIDITTDHCGNVNVSGRNVPTEMLDLSIKKVTNESIARYSLKKIKG